MSPPPHHQCELSNGSTYNVISWNGTYSSAKVALHLMTDALTIECSYLNKNFKAMLIVTGAVKSNITNNAAGYEVPPGSLFKQLTQAIHKRIVTSQGDNATTAEEFSR